MSDAAPATTSARAGGFPLVPLATPDARRTALSMPDRSLTYGELRSHTGHLVAALQRHLGPGKPAVDHRAAVPVVVAVPALARCETVVAVLAALDAGCAVVPVNVGSADDEVDHVVRDAAPAVVVVPTGVDLPAPMASVPRVEVDLDAPQVVREVVDTGSIGQEPAPGAVPSADDPALVVYTSGTTGPPKGVVLSHGALAADLDALAAAWHLTSSDVVVHALPLFHVHGLVLGVLGPLRAGGAVHHLGRFDVTAVGAAFGAGATVLYAVPTMYHRLADALPTDPTVRTALASARLLVSGSAGLPAHDRERITAATGRPVLERYGMTETLITCAMTVDGGGEPGTVGPPLPGVELRLVDEVGRSIAADDTGAVGEIHVRSATLFSGYLHRPEATAACFTDDGWFRTGDLGTWSPTGAVRISGRRSLDLIKSGGYRIGAGEVENALLGHPGVAQAAVTGEPDADLGERIVAWVVPVPGSSASAADLVEHVSCHLSHHKRPREVRFVDDLPRNHLGKVLKRDLVEGRWPVGPHADRPAGPAPT